MYFYLYDAFLRDKKYERTLARIESRVFQLGMQGKSEKLTILKSMNEVLRSALTRDATTIVLVGDDGTFNRAVSYLFRKEVLLGFLPIGEGRVGKMLGIPSGEASCDTLSRRIITHLDVGQANAAHFLTHFTFGPASDIVLTCDDRATVTCEGEHFLTVYSVGWPTSDPTDGTLEVVVEPLQHKHAKPTVLSCRTLHIDGPKTCGGYADGKTVVKPPIDIAVHRKAVRMIVGKVPFLQA